MAGIAQRAFGTTLLACAAAFAGCGGEQAHERPAALPMERAFEAIDELARSFPAPDTAPLSWPRDHGAHPEQFLESWLFAGRVHDEAGRAIGFQLLIQRLAVRASPLERDSSWATREVYRAQLSIEPAAAPVRADERVSRSAQGLAGAAIEPAKAWLENWQFRMQEDPPALLLTGHGAGAGLELRLGAPEHPPVNVENELYRGYWWPALVVQGTIALEGRTLQVAGQAMMDRLWGRALPTGRGQLALARLWLELEDGVAVRCEQLRRRGGGGRPLTECLAHGVADATAVALEPLEFAQQRGPRAHLPLRWHVALPTGQRGLRLAPLGREHPLSPDRGSWRGIVADEAAGTPWGLLELSNFAPP